MTDEEIAREILKVAGCSQQDWFSDDDSAVAQLLAATAKARELCGAFPASSTSSMLAEVRASIARAAAVIQELATGLALWWDEKPPDEEVAAYLVQAGRLRVLLDRELELMKGKEGK